MNGPIWRERSRSVPSLDYIERAYDDAKYGDFSRRPYMDIILPSMLDPSMAPPGKHVMSIFVQYAPYHLKNGTWPEQREALGDAVIDTLSEYAPNLKNIILHRQVVTPWDLEQEFGLTEGNIFQGELTLDQLFFSARCRAGQSIARRSRIYTCAAPAPIREAVSWRRRDASRRWRFSKT